MAGWPSASRWNRRLVRKASPSPANMRAGSSPSRLKGNTPAVKGKWPGRCSARSQRSSSPCSVTRGRATRGMRVPDSEVRHRAGRRSPSVASGADLVRAAVGVAHGRPQRLPLLQERRPSPVALRCRSGRPGRPGRRCRPRAPGPGLSTRPPARPGGPRRPAGPWWRGSPGRSRRSRPGSGGGWPGRWPTPGWTVGRPPGPAPRRSTARPSATSWSLSRWNSAVTPSSLNREAMVPNTGSAPAVTGGAPVVPAPLAAHLAEGVVGAPAVELVDGHHVGQLEHVDLLELGGGAVLGRHHVERDIGDVGDGGVALADARGSRR